MKILKNYTFHFDMISQLISITYNQVSHIGGKDEISPLKRIRKTLFLKFEHRDLMIGGDLNLKFLRGHLSIS
jgi:hypothetical protein